MSPIPFSVGEEGTLPSSRVIYFNVRAAIFAARDAVSPSAPTNMRQPHDLQARPFDHLGIWAYLALGFIVLALTTVFVYMLYSCYHNAQGRMDTELVASGANEAGEENFFCDDAGKLNTVRPSGISGMGGGIGAMARMSDRVGEAGEKMRVGSVKLGKTVLEMKGIGSGEHQRNNSESERNINSVPHNSQTSLSNVSDISSASDLDAHYLTSPPLALTSERAATYIPFHLPPPPTSPTPAHKKHVERQYRGKAQQSPISPSPSFATAYSPPPITPKLKSPAVRSNVATWSGNTAIGSEHSHSNLGKAKAEGNQERGPSVQFDSNNIRFVPPLNPFMTPSAASIWNDPKLSPIHGSIITTANRSNSSGTSFTEENSFVKALTAALKTPPSSGSPKVGRVIQPSPDSHHCGDDKENDSPFPRRKETTKTDKRPDIIVTSAKPNTRPGRPS